MGACTTPRGALAVSPARAMQEVPRVWGRARPKGVRRRTSALGKGSDGKGSGNTMREARWQPIETRKSHHDCLKFLRSFFTSTIRATLPCTLLVRHCHPTYSPNRSPPRSQAQPALKLVSL